MSNLKPKVDASSITFPKPERERLTKLILDIGEAKAAAAIQLNPNTLARIAAGFPVRRGTAALFTAWLRGQK